MGNLITKATKKVYRKTKRTLSHLHEIQKWADPSTWASTEIVRRHPEEAAAIAVAVVAENPGLAAPAVERIVVEELKRLSEDKEPIIVLTEPADDEPPDWTPEVEHGNFETGYHQPQTPMPAPAVPVVRPVPMQQPPMWSWRPIQVSPYLVVAEVVCPFSNFSPHSPSYIPLPYFLPMRGFWSQCGFCGNWSFVP